MCQRELGDVVALRVKLFAHHAFDGHLELEVFGGVDERVDAAVREQQHDTGMV